MKLTRAQKEALLQWVGEGLESGEINKRAALFDPPFHLRRQQVDYYRQTRAGKIDELTDEDSPLKAGLALRAERVRKLAALADLLEQDIFGDSLWVDDVKAVNGEPVYITRFNAPEVSEYRGVLDDIAKEVGDRKTTVKHAGDPDNPIEVETVHFYIPSNGRPHPGRES